VLFGVGSGYYLYHALCSCCGAGVNSEDPGMRMRTAQYRYVQRSRQVDVRDKPSSARNEEIPVDRLYA